MHSTINFISSLREGLEKFYPPPAVADGIVYFGSENYRVYALDAVTGKQLWCAETDYYITSSPAVSDTFIYIASEDGHLYALDITTGKKLWDILVRGIIHSSPAVAEGSIFIGSHDGNLYALNKVTRMVKPVLPFPPTNMIHLRCVELKRIS